MSALLNAKAHLDEIIAAQMIVSAASNGTFNPEDFSDDMTQLAAEMQWDGDDEDTLADEVMDHLLNKPLSIESFARKSSWSVDWVLTHYQVTLSFGGPSLVFRYSPDDHECRWIYCDAFEPTVELPLTDDEEESLTWFASILGLDA